MREVSKMKLKEKYNLIADLVGNDVMFTKVHASSRSELSKSLRPLVERFQFESAGKKGFKPGDIDDGGGEVQYNKCYLYEYKGPGIYEVFIHHHEEKSEFESLRELLEWPMITRALRTETLQTMTNDELARHIAATHVAACDQIAKHRKSN
jgi:hypothetical protein